METNSRESIIIAAFEDYSRITGLSPTTVGNWGCRDTRLYTRLKNGGSCNSKTAQEMMDWFKNNPPTERKAPPGAKQNGKHRSKGA